MEQAWLTTVVHITEVLLVTMHPSHILQILLEWFYFFSQHGMSVGNTHALSHALIRLTRSFVCSTRLRRNPAFSRRKSRWTPQRGATHTGWGRAAPSKGPPPRGPSAQSETPASQPGQQPTCCISIRKWVSAWLRQLHSLDRTYETWSWDAGLIVLQINPQLSKPCIVTNMHT